ncbi:MAG TPA: hypothetical protein PK358_17680 [Spirochaetota bacterium]|nr:hypothetical protein [Spirochaetota bacterium]HPJ36671.1 hypothetical protein [Spirochaetota bacterium]
MDAIIDLFYSVVSFISGLVRGALDWFLGLELLNKVIVLNSITAFFAIILPVGKYYIFESWFVINNPLAVYLIAIAIIMFGTIFLSGRKWVFPLRAVINAWYLVALLYMWLTHSFSHAPYSISYGLVFNIAAPLVYGAASVMVYFSES